jgi:hypothetical protein
MKRPLWTHVFFAGFVAVGLLVLATVAMKQAVLYAHFKVSPLAREQPENTRAVLCLAASMLLVVAAIVLPLVIRKKAQAYLKRALMKSVQVLLVALLLAPVARAAEPPEPRYDEAGKRHIIELTRTLENNPLGDKDKRQRSELLQWWVSGPITLKWCSDLLTDGANEKARPIVVTQGMFGAGARMLEVGKPLSPTELATAGVESALAAYKNALRADRSYADKVYDELAADPARRKAYVARHVEQCAKAEKK